jgi:hypothetical protein
MAALVGVLANLLFRSAVTSENGLGPDLSAAARDEPAHDLVN